MAVTTEGTDGGLQPVEAFAEIEVEVIGVGRGGRALRQGCDEGKSYSEIF